MLIIAIVFVVVSIVWLFAARGEPVGPVVRRAGIVCAIVCAIAALVLLRGRAVPALLGLAALWYWLRLRGRGGEDLGDGGHEPPDDPDPEPDPGLRLDPDAFDRARAEWERELRQRR